MGEEGDWLRGRWVMVYMMAARDWRYYSTIPASGRGVGSTASNPRVGDFTVFLVLYKHVELRRTIPFHSGASERWAGVLF